MGGGGGGGGKDDYNISIGHLIASILVLLKVHNTVLYTLYDNTV